MFTTAADFRHTRLLRVLAVLTTIFTPFFRRTIAGGMRTLVLFLVLCHRNTPLSFFVELTGTSHPRTAGFQRQGSLMDSGAQLLFAASHLDSTPSVYPIESDDVRRRR